MNKNTAFVISLLLIFYFSNIENLMCDEIKRPKLMSERLFTDSWYMPYNDSISYGYYYNKYNKHKEVWSKSLNYIGIQGKIYTENVSSAGISFNYNQAIRTFREISIGYGGESPYLKIWAANQNRVFSACSSSSNQYNPPIRPNYKLLPKRAQSDFLYQLGSWHFYIGDYKEALKYYEDLEKMADAPQRPFASYMTIRTLAYMGHIPEAYNKIEKIVSDPSLHLIHYIARDYRFIMMSNSYVFMSYDFNIPRNTVLTHLDWLNQIIHSNLKEIEKTDQMLIEKNNALQQIDTYFPLYDPDSRAVNWWITAGTPKSIKMQAVKTLARKDDFIDWMQAKWAYNIFDVDWLWSLHKKDHPYWQQNRDIVLHALEKWKTTKDGVWLQVAIQRVHPHDMLAQEIMADAKPLLQSPWAEETQEFQSWFLSLWQHVIRIHLARGEAEEISALLKKHWDYFDKKWKQYGVYSIEFKSVLRNIFRWYIYTGKFNEARSFLGDIKKKFPYSFYKWESILALNIEEAESIALSSHKIYHYYSDNYENDDYFWRAMVDILPLKELYRIATNKLIYKEYRKMIAKTIFTRAILLKYDNKKIEKYADLAGNLNPSIRELINEHISKDDYYKYISLLLKIPRLRPTVYLEFCQDPVNNHIAKFSEFDIDSHNPNDNNWWCRYDISSLKEEIFNLMKIIPIDNKIFSSDMSEDEIKPYLEQQKQLLNQHPYFALIDQQEIAALERVPSGPQYLSTAVIGREFAQPFIRSPEERNERAADLYRAVRTTRYGCRRDGSHAAYSRRAFLVLHRRYGDTPWARSTPYWFK